MTVLNVGWLGSARSEALAAKTSKGPSLFRRENKGPSIFRFPIAEAFYASLIGGPVLVAAWAAVMWFLAGWAAAVLLTLPLLLSAGAVGFVLRKMMASTNQYETCLKQLKLRPQDIDYSSPRLGAYPYPYIKHAVQRDQEGIVQWPRPGREPLRATLIIAQYALCLFDKLLKKQDAAMREDFLRHADALVSRQQTSGPWDGCWIQNHRQEYYAPHAEEHISSMVQSQAMSVLVRAYQMTGELKYMAAAERAMKPFEKSVAEGGVRTDYPDGKVFFEEYCLPPFYSHTLNGFIFTLFGLEELARACNHERARYWFRRGVETLAQPDVLEGYDLGYTSTYDRLNRKLPASDYHRVHISQLMAMYDMTGCEVFRKTAERWLSYTKSFSARIRHFVHLLANRTLTGVVALKDPKLTPARAFDPALADEIASSPIPMTSAPSVAPAAA